MKKLLALGATVLLSVFIMLIEINYEKGTSMYCNAPTYEFNWEENTNEYVGDEITEMLDIIEPLTEWQLKDEHCLTCFEWRAIRWMKNVTCVQNRLIKGSRI